MISRRAFLLPGLSLCVPLTGCIVAGADSGWVTQRDEKRFSVEGTPEVVLIDLRRLHRDSVVGSAGSDGRSRKTRG